MWRKTRKKIGGETTQTVNLIVAVFPKNEASRKSLALKRE
ncbi:hypothetical protein RU98_GL002789 [Enterococcus caccae]|nr:hypothetical protein RU98_GL002789 [Enterococcus caccae]